MQINVADLDREAAYKLMSGVIVPRPVAWITSQDEAGLVNLAPFSAFTYVSIDPPMVGINIARLNGERKDTARNISRAREFVVNIGEKSQIGEMHASAAEHPAKVSEVALLGLALAPSVCVQTPRLADAPASMECTLHRVVSFGDDGAEFYVGRIVAFHVRDGLVENGKVDSSAWQPIARLGGPNYASLSETITMRPVPPAGQR